MNVSHVEVLVEEPSMEDVLRKLLPRILGKTTFGIYAYQCKSDLLQRLPDRLRGYARWIGEESRIVVVVDRDNEDCRRLKRKLEKAAEQAGLPTRSRRIRGRFTVINRIAIEELEAWYFGDWEAVRAAFPRVRESVPANRRFRDPDAIGGGTWESFERVLQDAGYFKTGLRKREVARTIAVHMEPGRNRSTSFRHLVEALEECAS